MRKRVLCNKHIMMFEKHLKNEEKSENTINKYIRDVRAFAKFLGNEEIEKSSVILYKNQLLVKNYAIRSINSMLASLNSLFIFLGWSDCKVKFIKLQKRIYCSKEKELTKNEYIRLINAAKRKGNARLEMLIQTICGTGIRVSELQYITVETAKRGEATVASKGKIRSVFIVKELQKKLLNYASKNHIVSGPIFITRSGKPMGRTNIWREMKNLCALAGIASEKVYPHNLRHLFARTFYQIEKDIAKLADVLGHSDISTTRIYIIASGYEHHRLMGNMRLII